MTDQIAQNSARPAWETSDHIDDQVVNELRQKFGPDAFTFQPTRTGMPVVWVKREQLIEVMQYLKSLPKPYVMLYDLHGVDEAYEIPLRLVGSEMCIRDRCTHASSRLAGS